MAASERNNFIQSNAAKDKKSFFNISINILIKFLTLQAFKILIYTW